MLDIGEEPGAPNAAEVSRASKGWALRLRAAVRQHRGHVPSGAALIVGIGLIVWATIYFLRPPVSLNPDEEYLNAFAVRLIDGSGLPYVDAVSHRGPVLYWMAAVVIKVFGWSSFVPMRMMAAAVAIATMLLLFAAGCLTRRPLAGAVAALGIPLIEYAQLGPWNGIAFNGEHLLVALMLAALVSLLIALRPGRAPSLRLLVLGGVFTGLGVLAKQVGMTHVFPFLAWVAITAIARPGLDRRARLKVMLSYCAGAALPVLLVVLLYAVVGEFSTLIYWMSTYNRTIYMDPYTPELMWKATDTLIRDNLTTFAIGVPLVVGSLVLPLVRARRCRDVLLIWDAAPLVPVTALQTVAGLIGAHAAMRGFKHYYVQLVPWAALLVGMLVSDLLASQRSRAPRGRFLAEVLLLGALLSLTWFGMARMLDDQTRVRAQEGFRDPRQDPVCKLFAEHTTPDDYVFIWGFRPAFYTYCNRKPASRFVYTTMVSGLVPWFTKATRQEDERRTAPHAREQLIEDLEKTKPPIILDWAASIGNRPMSRYEPLASYMNEHYCSLQRVNGVETFGRRLTDGNCPPRIVGGK